MLLDSAQAEIGWTAAEFELPDADGKLFSLDKIKTDKGLVIAFICNHCPYVKAIADRLAADASTLQEEGIGVAAINSNDFRHYADDSPANMKLFSEKYNFTFPYLVDEDQSVGRTYGAVCTPDFYGFNGAGELQYRGRLDDAKMQDPANRTEELVNAMRLIAETGRGPGDQLPSMGCSIKWRE